MNALTPVSCVLVLLAVSASASARPAPMPAADVLELVHAHADLTPTWCYTYETERAGVTLRKTVASAASDNLFISSSKQTPVYSHDVDPFAQRLRMTGDTFVVEFPNQLWYRRHTADGTRQLPGTAGDELMLHLVPSWPLSSYDPPPTAGGTPVVVSALRVDDLAEEQAGVEQLDGHWCHVLALHGGDKVYLDLRRNATLVARDYADVPGGTPLRRLRVTEHRQLECGNWVPSALQIELLDALSAGAPATAPFVARITAARLNGVVDAVPSPVSGLPGVLRADADAYEQAQPGGEEHADVTGLLLGHGDPAATRAHTRRQQGLDLVFAAVAPLLVLSGRRRTRLLTPDNGADAYSDMKQVFQQRRGFSLLELLVVLGIIAVLLALALPALSRARAASQESVCASNLRQTALALHAYSLDNAGWIPRDSYPHLDGTRPYQPYWGFVLLPYVTGEPAPEHETFGYFVEHELAAIYRCPSHPLAGTIPASFIMNAFAFETRPEWWPSGPTQLARTVEPSLVVLFAESRAGMPGEEAGPDFSFNYGVDRHDAWRPSQLPNGFDIRVTEERHRSGTNLAYFDGHVAWQPKPKMRLSHFDDGLRSRRGMPVRR